MTDDIFPVPSEDDIITVSSHLKSIRLEETFKRVYNGCGKSGAGARCEPSGREERPVGNCVFSQGETSAADSALSRNEEEASMVRFLKGAVLSLVFLFSFGSAALCSDILESVVSAAADAHREEMKDAQGAVPTTAFTALGQTFGAAFGFEFDEERMSRLWQACRTPSLARSDDAVSAVHEMARVCGVSGYEVAVLKPENTFFLSERALRDYHADGAVMVFFEDMTAKTRRETERNVKFLDNIFTLLPGSKSGRVLRDTAKREILANSARTVQSGARLLSFEKGVATLSPGSERIELSLAELENRSAYIVGMRRSREVEAAPQVK